MRITIDNEDGRGAVDYTAAVAAEGSVTVQRTLNKPSLCTAELVLGLPGLPVPSRRGRVCITTDAGTVLFTGYLAIEPVAVYAGVGVTGPVYRARISAVSDEWMLDKQGSGGSPLADGVALAVSGSGLVKQLVQGVQGSSGTAGLTVAGEAVGEGTGTRAVGIYAVQAAEAWSVNAGAAASASYAGYRAVDGVVSVQPAGVVTHTFSDADGTLDVRTFALAHTRELANDVTLSGEEEPAAYVQEIFLGDGATTVFELSRAVFRGTNRTLVNDRFDGKAIDSRQWNVADDDGSLMLTGAGLTMNGGAGTNVQATLTALNLIEMGGTLMTELGGVQLGPGSDGMLAGFYGDSLTPANCFAGFRVRQSGSTTGSVTELVPMLNGTEAGSVFTLVEGHSYTLRLRLFSPEMFRRTQRYFCIVDGAVKVFGAADAGTVSMQAVFELVDEAASSNTAVTVLYDTVQAGAPAAGAPETCSFVAVNSTNLYGSIGSLQLTRPDCLWVSSTYPDGTQGTRLVGAAGQGVDCEVSYGSAGGTGSGTGIAVGAGLTAGNGSALGSQGKVTFFAGRVPAAGERVTVQYRVPQRAVARLADAASVMAEAASGAGTSVPGLSRWMGKVIAPPARSSADCESAAQAVLAMATARSAALAGQYRAVNPAQDMWPGDVLAVTHAGQSHALMVRSVEVADEHAAPEVVTYHIAFANDWATEWADSLGLRLSGQIAGDAVLPATATSGPAEVLTNLPQLTVTNLTNAALQVDTGTAAPAGGGFEVRRRDGGFGMGADAVDLVLRSPVQSFSIPRTAQVERFYVRMYDASIRTVYSRWSSALFVHAPVS